MAYALFTNFARQLQQEAARSFEQTDFGRLLRNLGNVPQRAGNATSVARIIRQHGQQSPTSCLRQLMGSDLGSVVQAVERYSRSPSGAIIAQFLQSLGPAGGMIRALASGSGRNQLERNLAASMEFIRAFGGEVIPGEEWGSVEDLTRGTEAAIAKLTSKGYTVIPPGAMGGRGGVRASQPQLQPGRKTLTVPLADGGHRRVKTTHPLVTGEFVRTHNSTNVWEFGYDIDKGYLYVRFSAKDQDGSPAGPGSLYRYSGVTPEEFLSLYNLRDGGGGGGPGDWVWDHLRVRGTVSGHQKDYELVGVMSGYVPRKATVKPIMEQGRSVGFKEVFIPRRVKSLEGQWMRSSRPEEDAGPAMYKHGRLGPQGPRGPRGPQGPRGAGAGPR